ncbi:hypothetical protein [Natronoglycomyces albus]|uniref:Uncharacterized protein n=1 Tax=Natronoglycomyces albus TaxID=2811108 RepID=A0A895XI23_9ACTN|nr:hypothetical protein [Natronoglycomyces albus]QSB04984.1 hypothetical protein JQS30_14650 [Natronoglycomyces albus]
MTPDRTRVRSLLASVATGETEATQAHAQSLKKTERAYYYQLATALFTEALAVYFRRDHSLDAVQEFSIQLERDERGGEPAISRQDIEGLIRAMMGEEERFGDLTPEKQFRVQLLTIKKVTSDSKTFWTRFDFHLDEAETIVREWYEDMGRS